MNDHDHGHGARNRETFSDAEWQQLREADLAAGRAVIVLMLSIFLIGVVLYSIVVWSVL